MHFGFISVIVLVFLSGSSYGQADTEKNILAQYKAQIRKSLIDAGINMSEGWVYQQNLQQTIDGEIEQKNANYQPHKKRRWELLTINNRKATENEIVSFAQTKREEQRDLKTLIGTDANKYQFLRFIDEASIKIEEESKHYITFTFIGRNPKFKDTASNNLIGELVFDKNTRLVKSLTVTNSTPFTPKALLEVKTWQVNLEFTEVKSTPLLLKYTSKMSGVAGYLIDVDVSVVIRNQTFTPIAGYNN